MIKSIFNILPKFIKDYFRQGGYRVKISNFISPYVPETICIDVGASYYPHTNWFFFLSAPKVKWFVVEPNVENIGYTKNWAWPCKFELCNKGLSATGGNQTLYITNTDSGSSLLLPKIPPSMRHKYVNLDYFYPIREQVIETVTLVDVISNYSDKAPIFIKLDTQGSELDILRGANTLFAENLILGIEMESTMLAEPIMVGSGKFWEACQFLEGNGFELIHIKPIYAPSNENLPPKCRTYLPECDAIFALRWDLALKLPVHFRVSLVVFYLTNYLYLEVISILKDDHEIRSYLELAGCNVDDFLIQLQDK